jgi:hypothetical protein
VAPSTTQARRRRADDRKLIRVLADERTLGGPELEVAEITFPAGAGGSVRLHRSRRGET